MNIIKTIWFAIETWRQLVILLTFDVALITGVLGLIHVQLLPLESLLYAQILMGIAVGYLAYLDWKEVLKKYPLR